MVEGCGAYVAGMSAKNYNSFPEAPEASLLVLFARGGVLIYAWPQSYNHGPSHP